MRFILVALSSSAQRARVSRSHFEVYSTGNMVSAPVAWITLMTPIKVWEAFPNLIATCNGLQDSPLKWPFLLFYKWRKGQESNIRVKSDRFTKRQKNDQRSVLSCWKGSTSPLAPPYSSCVSIYLVSPRENSIGSSSQLNVDPVLWTKARLPWRSCSNNTNKSPAIYLCIVSLKQCY